MSIKTNSLTNRFISLKKQAKKWVLLTAFDAPSGEILEDAKVDIILVGDSLAMVALGYSSTTDISIDEMIHHAKAVRRGAKKSFIVGDLPLKGIQKGPKQALVSAKRFMNEAGCNAVKLEWAPNAQAILEILIKNKIPVMGHVGLTPQTAQATGGFKVRGTSAKNALEILAAAKAFQKGGAFSVVLECVPEKVASLITEQLNIPTIGIGAGRYCDGQILVYSDVVGRFEKFKARFVKCYANVASIERHAVQNYKKDVLAMKFPAKANTFGINDEDFRMFKERIT